MDISLFDYDLPDALIAQRPAMRRDESRLLVYDRSDGRMEHKRFFDIVDYIGTGDVLVLNDSKVIRARLIGTKTSTGARIEVFLVHKRPADEAAVSGVAADACSEIPEGSGAALPEDSGAALPEDSGVALPEDSGVALPEDSGVALPEDSGVALPRQNAELWEALVKPSKRVRQGDTISFSEELQAVMVGDTGDGGRIVRFIFDGIFDEIIDRLGHTPLPPYIRREADKTDDERYQTVYSKVPGSVAAPTAGLHFTDELLGKIKAKGAEVVFVTLHVGLGTFRPVKADQIEDHHMHTEEYHISEAAANTINKAKAEGRRVVCVGTTSVRALESAAAENDSKTIAPGQRKSQAILQRPSATPTADVRATVAPGQRDTAIFIYPGYAFKVADALITNFHLPKSTLLMLVSAFAGREHMLDVYKHAVCESYRFFSYGDAMLIY
jgi:S-adenosylmethionine:tRNA ribosyltransferase-isomerase